MSTLPKRMRYQHGAYYFDRGRGQDGVRRWQHLGRDRDSAMRRYMALIGGDPDEAVAIRRHLGKMYAAAKRRAKVAAIEFLLTPEQFWRIANRSGLRCELTGIPFSLSWADGTKRRPFVPSLDRIDSAKPYTEANCRLVLCAVNYALNEWGEGVFRQIAAAMVDSERIGMLNEKEDISCKSL